MIIHIICYSILIILIFSLAATARKYKKLYEGKDIQIDVIGLYSISPKGERVAGDIRNTARKLYNDSGIEIKPYYWHIWKRAFDLGFAYYDEITNKNS